MCRSVVGEGILVAQLVANILKRLVQIVHVIRIEGAPPGLFRQRLHNFVAVGEGVFAVPVSFLARTSHRPPLLPVPHCVTSPAPPLPHPPPSPSSLRGKA